MLMLHNKSQKQKRVCSSPRMSKKHGAALNTAQCSVRVCVFKKTRHINKHYWRNIPKTKASCESYRLTTTFFFFWRCRLTKKKKKKKAVTQRRADSQASSWTYFPFAHTVSASRDRRQAAAAALLPETEPVTPSCTRTYTRGCTHTFKIKVQDIEDSKAWCK